MWNPESAQVWTLELGLWISCALSRGSTEQGGRPSKGLARKGVGGTGGGCGCNVVFWGFQQEAMGTVWQKNVAMVNWYAVDNIK